MGGDVTGLSANALPHIRAVNETVGKIVTEQDSHVLPGARLGKPGACFRSTIRADQVTGDDLESLQRLKCLPDARQGGGARAAVVVERERGKPYAGPQGGVSEMVLGRLPAGLIHAGIGHQSVHPVTLLESLLVGVVAGPKVGVTGRRGGGSDGRKENERQKDGRSEVSRFSHLQHFRRVGETSTQVAGGSVWPCIGFGLDSKMVPNHSRKCEGS